MEPSPSRTPADSRRMQNDVLEEHRELWWFKDPVKSVLCYTLAVLLILACGVGGIVLLSTTTSSSGEWRIAIGATLCILALLVLFKQLLSSAVQDMHCVQRRDHIDMLKSGGLSDTVVFVCSAIIILVCGVALLVLSFSGETPGSSTVLLTMHTVGVILITVGIVMLFAILIYVIVIICKLCASSRFHPRNISVFFISGQLSGTHVQNTTSSMANLI